MPDEPSYRFTDRFVTHSLKVEPPYFTAVFEGDKPFEVRKNDRAYQRGDLLILNEWHAYGTQIAGCRECSYSAQRAHFTGVKVYRWVTFVYSGDPRFSGVEPGHVVLGMIPAPEMDATLANEGSTPGGTDG
jgi:hypothetical protein